MKNLLSRNSIIVLIVIVGVLAGGLVFYLNQDKGKVLSVQEAGEKAIDFINQTIIEENITASLMEVIEEDLVYRIRLKINETGAEYESFITKDGQFLFPSGFDMTVQPVTQETEEEEIVQPSNVASFAQCLTDNQMKFYGSKYCGWCQKQRELFGEALQYIAYVECIDSETDQWSQECQDAGIDAVPTWQLPDGQMNPGYKTFEQLSEISGCPLE